MQLAAMRPRIGMRQVADPLALRGFSRKPAPQASSLRNTAPAGPIIAILARRPFRPTSRMVTRMPSTSRTRVSPSAYQSMDVLFSCSGSDCWASLLTDCIGGSADGRSYQESNSGTKLSLSWWRLTPTTAPR